MTDDDRQGFVFHTPNGDVEMDIDQVKTDAEKGDCDAQYALAMAYLFGWDVEEDAELGYAYLRKAVDNGQTEAMTLMVRLFMQGEYNGITSDEAAQLSIKAAKDSIPDAMLYAGLAYMDGVSVPQDYAQAARYFRNAANKGNSEARVNLAYLHQEGLGVRKDETKAFKLYKTAAGADNLNARFHLGVCYEFGVGTVIDHALAAEQYTICAGKGDPIAMERLGHLYTIGFGDQPVDMERAFELFVQAASSGVPSAMMMTGYCYLTGNGVEPDVTEARKWLKMAADNDMPEAKELLAQIASE